MINLDAMALFAKVVEHKSFSEAAKRVGMPVSTVSRKVAQLEETLGVRLLERSTRRLRLTELGQDYYAFCRRAVEELESANLMINDRQAEVSGVLRISVPPSLERSLVVPLVSGFQALYPKARVRVWATQRKLNLVEDGVDVAFRVGALEDSGLTARKLIAYRHILVAAPGYLAASGTPKRPSDIKQHRLICFADWFGEVTWTFTKGAVTEKHQVEEAFSLNDFAGIQMAAEAKQGITELPSIICGEALEEGRLVEVLPDWTFSPFSTTEVPLAIVHPSNRNISRLVRLFKDFCIEKIDELLPTAKYGSPGSA